MRLYRLCKARYSGDVLGGEGGLTADGRWHTAGRRVVYCATSEALAVLEVRVHVGRFVPHHAYAMHVIDVPDRLIETLAPERVPAEWNAVPHTAASQAIGDAWLTRGRTPGLRVPSVHSRSDANVLLNPVHREHGRLRLVEAAPYRFDARLF